MTGADAQALGERIHVANLERALVHQSYRSRYRGRSSHPGWRSRRTFGPATQARTKTGFRSRRSGGKVTNVLFLWWARWTDGATVDACGQHANEESSIEARVSSEPGASADFGIEVHLAPRYPIGPEKTGHFRTSMPKNE